MTIMSTFTLIHVVISLIALVSGFVAVYGLLTSRQLEGWTLIYLVTIVATSVTGFFLPADRFLPSHAVGIISLVILAAAIAGRYVFHLAGAWRWIYAAGLVAALYLNAFVGVVQAFQKISALHALAPTQSEPPFAIVQVVVLVAFGVIGVLAGLRHHRAATA
jgi:hypothetical protein